MEKTISTTSTIVASQTQAGTNAIADAQAKSRPQSTLRTYFAMLVQVSRWHLIGVIVVTVLFSLSEGIGIALLLPTLQVAGFNMAGQGEAGKYATRLANAFVSIGLHPTLILLLGVFVTLVGARTVLGQIQSVWMYKVQQDVEHHLRRRLYHAIADANWLFVCRSRATDFTHALTHEIYRIGNGTNLALVFTGEVVLGMLYMAIAFALSAGMTALVLISGAMLTFVFRGRTHADRRTGRGSLDYQQIALRRHHRASAEPESGQDLRRRGTQFLDLLRPQ